MRTGQNNKKDSVFRPWIILRNQVRFTKEDFKN